MNLNQLIPAPLPWRGLNPFVNQKLATVLCAAMLAWFPGQTALAQLIPDDTLGAESSQVILDAGGFPLDLIQGGAIRDQNLFHSFAEFNIDGGRSAYFIVPADAIANIISRVTGDNPSNLLGLLGTITANGDPTPANLYFINPNGIVFGENAELDISGSFFASTAEAIRLGDGIYSATTPETSSLLTVNPSAMFGNYLTAASGDITSRGELAVGGSLTLAANRLDLGGSLLAPEALTLLARGDVAIADSIILTLESGPQDAIEENILIQGETISITDSFLIVSSQFALNNANAANVDVLPIGGNLVLRGNNIAVTDSILSTAGNIGSRGDVRLTATETIDLVATQDQSFGLTSLIDDMGQAGNIVLTAANLNIVDISSETNFNNFNLLATAFNDGNGGNIIFNVADTVRLEGNSLSTVAITGVAGNIRISTPNLQLRNGATLQASTINGNAGDITVAADTVSMNGFGRSPILSDVIDAQPSAIFATAEGDRGEAGKIQITANRLVLDDFAGIGASADGLGQAGEIQIVANELQLRNGGNISSNASGSSVAGDINLEVSGTATFVGGASSSLNPGGVINPSGVFSRTFDDSDGGSINLSATRLNLLDGATISTENFGAGDGGDIILDVAETVVLEGISPLNQRSSSTINSSTVALGDSGDIRIRADGLILRDNAFIASGTTGQGNAGQQIFDVGRIDLLSGGLFADTFAGSTGNGGSIIANARTVILDGAFISSQSQGTGVAGPIILNAANLLLLIDSDISTVATQASGGDIAVNTAEAAERGLVVLLGDSDITTESFGDGGNITLLGTAVIAFDDSDIIARSQSGRGGNITLTNFFSETIPPDNQPPFDGDGQVDVNADGQIAAGTINSPDTSFVENSLNELSGDLVDTTALTAGSCIARREGTEGSFVVTGGEGLPQRPGGDNIAVYPTGTVQTVTESSPAFTLQEPQSVYRLADGRLVLSHECGQR